MILSGCRGDGVHLGERGLFYSPGSRAGQVCRYAAVTGSLDVAAAARGNPEEAIAESGTALSAQPGTGGRYLQVEGEGFASLGCDNWVDADAIRDVAPGDDVPAGMFRVGVDLAVGHYEGTGGPACAWQVTDSARADARVLASGGGPGPVQVKLRRQDTFLSSAGCGALHLVAGS